MLTDFYELTMAGGYFENGLCGTVAYFDMFFRRVPDNGGYAVMAGIEQVMDYINNLHLHKRTSPIFGIRAFSAKRFWTI